MPPRVSSRRLGPPIYSALGLGFAGCGVPQGGSDPMEIAVLFVGVVSVSATLALLHLLLFAFESRDRRNLLFSLLAAAFALVTFLDYRERIGADVVVPGLGPLQWWGVSALILAAARFAYSLRSERAPRRFWVYTVIIVGLLVVGVPFPQLFGTAAGLLGMIVTLDALITVLAARRELQREAWIVAAGAGLFALSGLLQLGLDLAGASELGNVLAPYVWGGLALLLASSIYLARTFARTGRELERRLAEVEELSARTLAQEKAAREQEVRRRLLEAENERKGRELEAARSLQLAMLPQELPEVAGWELAATMITATEVGGDYYDATLGDAAAAWIAVGDAVGHGARAGSLVAVAKGLFAGVAAQPSPAAALERFDAALRGMELQRAHLALIVGRLDGDSLEIAAAGMPPALVRRASGRVEEVAFSTLPLGAPLAQEYADRRLELVAGDLVLMLTDGLIELPADDGSPVGYEPLRRAIADAPAPGDEPLASWLDRLVRGRVGGEAPPDDVTVMVLRVL